MTSEQFTYWLQGCAEMGGDAPTAEQWQMIKEFVKVTPTRGPAITPAKYSDFMLKPCDMPAPLQVTC
jgi:hypothetical protein